MLAVTGDSARSVLWRLLGFVLRCGRPRPNSHAHGRSLILNHLNVTPEAWGAQWVLANDLNPCDAAWLRSLRRQGWSLRRNAELPLGWASRLGVSPQSRRRLVDSVQNKGWAC
eukprot:7391480-Prymnesium_polylepis.4